MSSMTDLYQEINLCHQCEIAKHRTKTVPGEGSNNADLMFIGEAPGWYEDQQGRPFVGPAGQFLDKLLTLINLNRSQVYIANVIKCRPQGNRDPLPVEIQNCHPYLIRQIEIIQPRIIITLGRYSMSMFFPGKSISKIHGTAIKQDNTIYYAMYHPAAALHQQSLRQTIETDMLKIPSLLTETIDLTDIKPPPKQLSMF
jgi:DNA polymerase